MPDDMSLLCKDPGRIYTLSSALHHTASHSTDGLSSPHPLSLPGFHQGLREGGGSNSAVGQWLDGPTSGIIWILPQDLTC